MTLGKHVANVEECGARQFKGPCVCCHRQKRDVHPEFLEKIWFQHFFTLSLQTRFVWCTQRAISDLAGRSGSSAVDGLSTKSQSTLFTFGGCLQMENWELLSRTMRREETGFSITETHITTWRITQVRLSRCEGGSCCLNKSSNKLWTKARNVFPHPLYQKTIYSLVTCN